MVPVEADLEAIVVLYKTEVLSVFNVYSMVKN